MGIYISDIDNMLLDSSSTEAIIEWYSRAEKAVKQSRLIELKELEDLFEADPNFELLARFRYLTALRYTSSTFEKDDADFLKLKQDLSRFVRNNPDVTEVWGFTPKIMLEAEYID